MSRKPSKRKSDPSVQRTLHNIEVDPRHHLTGSFLPQSPNGSRTSTPTGSRFDAIAKNEFYRSNGLWNDFKTLRWMRVPSSSFKMLMLPIVLYAIFSLFGIQPNPFAPMLLVSYPIADSAPDDPRYAKGWLDIVFIAYHIIFFSFVRQFAILEVIQPIARRFGIKKQSKLDRFGEQAYSMLYYGVMGFWGAYIMSSLPTWWYRTEFYWIGYPHWDMNPVLKRYYLMHFSYWIQQLIVLALKIEKPRKDFQELVAHHIVTLWLIGWSYGINLTLIGNAIFVSMDIPDTFLAFSKLCNYLQLERTKMVSFAVFIVVWTYFRHWLNLVILYSVWTEYDLIPDAARFFHPSDGVWLVWWMKYQVFVPILLLQFLNLFWYFLILRILVRALSGDGATDVRSDDEDDGEVEKDD
ncbi:longevity assurance proteins LAG1/LAC1 [Phellopilus nigrolimitatus]|nr:longevity assurance proteins LAG1/LAC1 [Phellopilus nigrolimitatus]